MTTIQNVMAKKPVARNEEELERLILAHTPRFAAVLNAAERRIKKGRGIKHRDFWKAGDKRRRG